MNSIPCIYTDGACSNNGQHNAKASWAFFEPETGKESAGLVENDLQTNNVGELLAIKRAIEYSIAQGYEQVRIITDSDYSIGSLSKWNIEKRIKGQQKKNYNLIKSILDLKKNIDVEFKWVRGHNGDYGNEVVDKLANRLVGM